MRDARPHCVRRQVVAGSRRPRLILLDKPTSTPAANTIVVYSGGSASAARHAIGNTFDSTPSMAIRPSGAPKSRSLPSGDQNGPLA